MFSDDRIVADRGGYRWADPALTATVIPRLLRDKAAEHPDRPLFSWRDGPAATYAETYRAVTRLAGGLAALGVAKGDTVLVMMRNSIEIIHTWFAAAALGAVEVPVNVHDRGRFLTHIIEDSAAEVIVIDADLLPSLAAVAEGVTTLRHVVVRGEAGSDGSIGAGIAIHDFAELAGADPVDDVAELAISDLMAILYTSGTTGPAKGIMMSYGHSSISAANFIEVMEIGPDDRYFICMPLFHSNAQIIQVMPVVMTGARASIWPEFNASRWLDQVRSVGATLSNTLGVMTEFVYRQPPRPDDADNPLRRLQTIPLPAAIAHDFEERFGVQCIDGYGLTDAGLISLRRPDEPLKPGSSGRPLPGYEVMVADPTTDEALAPKEIGEIMIRPTLPFRFMSGYWRNDAATRAAWRNLWFHSGDAGWFDEDGCLYFHDRIKDVIRVKGENVSSSEVESVLFEHPAIADCAAVAVRSPLGDDDVKVVLVLHPGARLDPAELIEFCIPRMPYFAVPRYVEVVEALPKTPTDKVRKVELRERGVTEATWDREEAGIRVRRS